MFSGYEQWPDSRWPAWKIRLWHANKVWKRIWGVIVWVIVASVVSMLALGLSIVLNFAVISAGHNWKSAGLNFTLTPGEQIVDYPLTWNGVTVRPLVTYNADGTLVLNAECDRLDNVIRCQGSSLVTIIAAQEIKGQPLTLRSEENSIATRAGP